MATLISLPAEFLFGALSGAALVIAVYCLIRLAIIAAPSNDNVKLKVAKGKVSAGQVGQ